MGSLHVVATTLGILSKYCALFFRYRADEDVGLFVYFHKSLCINVNVHMYVDVYIHRFCKYTLILHIYM